MHYRITLVVRMDNPRVEKTVAQTTRFDTFSVSLAANAASASEALAMAEAHLRSKVALTSRNAVEEAEVELVPTTEVPDSVLVGASADPNRPGIYWTSGRFFAEEGDEDQ